MGAVASGVCTSGIAASASEKVKGAEHRIRYCLNTSTIRGQGLAVDKIVDVVQQAGYDGMEPWIGELEKYVSGGGSLADLKRRIADAGLIVDSAIGFASWIVDDPDKRATGFEQMKRDMDLVLQIGGKRIAAPPVGATDQTDLDLSRAAERYRDLLELGRSIGVTPQLELWGFSKSLHRLGELMYVAVESGHPDACILPDVYHIYKGGSDFEGLKLISTSAIGVMHMNDYPDIPRETISDADRVYPGDGIAPLSRIIQLLTLQGFAGTFSLELFNRQYWQRDSLEVARTGLEKMKAAVEAAH
jgi:sugar phosphate isomerase/epimerase